MMNLELLLWASKNSKDKSFNKIAVHHANTTIKNHFRPDYTMMYRETKDKRYLRQAQGVTDFIMNHPNLPEDKIPYWDFNAPDIPNAYRDVSATTLMASAFIELSQLTKGKLSKKYLEIAEKQLETLTSPNYLADPNTNHNFILKHSVGHKPVNNEVDKPLIYTDYYYVEALVRYKKWILK